MPVKPPTFRPAHLPSREAVAKAYEDRRGSSRERGYGTRWDKEARAFRDEHPLCLGCQAVGRVTPAALVDHVVPHKGDRELFDDRSKWQPSCGPHHSIVKQELERLFAMGEVNAVDLWLNSSAAIALTHRLLRL